MMIKFMSDFHLGFYEEMKKKSICWDCYHMALFYVLGVSSDCRQHISDIYDFDERGINIDCLDEPWQTSGSMAVCRMAFNLFNGFCDNQNMCSPSNLFCTGYADYFYQGVKLRYPEYVDNNLYQVVRDDGEVILNDISSEIIASDYARYYEREDEDGHKYDYEEQEPLMLELHY